MNTRRTPALPAILGALLLASSAGFADDAPDPTGRWSGTTEVSGLSIPFAVEFVVTDEGCTATGAMQGRTGLTLEEVRCADDRVHFELAAPIGRAVWDGAWEDGALVGSFEQNGIPGTFRLEREAAGDAGDAAGPRPYAEAEVAFPSGAIELAGTLTVPEGDGPHPGVVLVTGSGPQDRDEELFGFRPFRVLADALGRAGIAVLRYDERGVGASGGEYAGATLHEFAADARAAVGWLRGRPEVDAARVGILGHSEGGVVGPYVAARDDGVAFLILLAPPTVDGETLLREQTRAILKASGVPPGAITAQLERQRRLFAAVRTGEGWDALEREVLAEARAQIAMLPEDARAERMAEVEAAVDAELNAARTPYYRVLLDHDPAPDLRAVSVPTLAVFGKLDTQVPAHLCVEPLERAFGGEGSGPLTVEVVDGANHLFQPAVSGAPSEYVSLPKRFVDGFVDLVVAWAVETTRRVEPEPPEVSAGSAPARDG